MTVVRTTTNEGMVTEILGQIMSNTFHLDMVIFNR